ncbi:MAG TPA: phosphoribosylformylglycinamidine cyclo-ligase [Terriglobales bacterium]|nr:phosphoribosylformylglycinamidine cyclo-ligase [Terriglobales bacterium]
MAVSYDKAGVSIARGDRVTAAAAKAARVTRRPEVVAGVGGFGALFRIPKGYRNPLMVTSTDGVGTKLRIALMMNRHRTIGIDLVAMNVNDILTLGAEPVAFLDYYVTDRLQPKIATDVLTGIAEGCRQAGCALIGGETAEHPGCFLEGEYDLAGFTIGVVEEDQVVDGKSIAPGDVIIGLPSNGLHSNGYSLVRHIVFEQAKLGLDHRAAEIKGSLGAELLRPTRIYVPLVRKLPRGLIKGMAHITGGGITGNLPRILPPGCQARLQLGSWKVPGIFALLQRLGGLSDTEMLGTFNMGIGYILVVAPNHTRRVLAALAKQKEKAVLLGAVEAAPRGTPPRVVFDAATSKMPGDTSSDHA